jgi:ATP-dependent helicase HrpB
LFVRVHRINPLPVDAFVNEIVDHVRRSRAAVVTAPPGAGKTTRVPPALTADGRVILLQPRRVAARSIASRVADERGWTLGREVGWQVRFERRFTGETRLLVVTEGVLTARLQSDPLLSDFTTIVLDEFHERSIHADLAIALARQAWRARDDLRIVVMSATLDARSVAGFFDGCPVVDVPGRTHPIQITYAPGRSVADAAVEALAETTGDVLCFLPGAGEIRRAVNDLQARTADIGAIDIVPLHGSLDADAQDRALRPSTPARRIIVATNIAETSVTVPRVTSVVDSGLQKVARYDADRGIDSLQTERITADAADQRAGRAGRIAPGVVRRLWDARDRLRPHREPDIHRIDLSSTCLDVVAWGGDPRTLEWFEPPRDAAVAAAIELLERLGLLQTGTVRLTPLGDQVRRLPLHPRLARMLIAVGGAAQMARACALLSERHILPPRTESTTSDLLSALDDWNAMPAHVRRAADVIADSMRHEPQSANRDRQSLSESAFRRAILSGYPDRVAQRRDPDSANVRLASGTGATIAPESGVRDGEFLVALDISRVEQSGPRAVRAAVRSSKGVIRDPQFATIRMASRIEREWLEPTASEVVHRFDAASGKVRAVAVERYDALVLAERSVPVDAETAANVLAEAWLARGPQADDVRLLRRLQFAGVGADVAALVRAAAYGARSLADVDLARALSPDVTRALDRDAPESLLVPSGRHRRLEYHEDGTVSVEVKLQEIFGLAETPRIGPRGEPVLLALTAPNGRPVQLTRDLRSFWDRTYPEVRKELRGRYPKHPWPEDPWTASPTARPKKRQG